MLIRFSKNRELIREEIDYWAEKNGATWTNSRYIKFTFLLGVYKEYRNLLRYRFNRSGIFIRFLGMICMIFLPTMDSLKIYADSIGKNLYIEHGVGTIISAQSIGNNCWINQQVTVGYNLDNKAPVIGNGVRICAGAKVLGGIIVEDNAIIGANSVVVRDVEENSIVAGVPARLIRKNTEHKLY